jgi:hypothetical protein
MCGGNRGISFNCDSVVERALRPIAEKRDVRFGAGGPLALDNVPFTDGPSLPPPQVKPLFLPVRHPE